MLLTLQYLNGQEQSVITEVGESVSLLKQRVNNLQGSTLAPSDCCLVHNGRTLVDDRLLSHYHLRDGYTIHVIFGLQGGGNDGGSIPTRGEMVKIKKYTKKSDSSISRRLRWITCAITRQPLVQPIVADALGNIFNKEALIKSLIEKTISPRYNHIRSLKHIYDVNFTFNPKYDPTQPVYVGVEVEEFDSPFECPITGVPANGQHSFSLIITCGHVLSDKGLQQIDLQNACCFVCQKTFSRGDILQLNPDEETQERIRSRINELNKRAVKEKFEEKKISKETKNEQGKKLSDEKTEVAKGNIKRKLPSPNDTKQQPVTKKAKRDANQGSVRNTLAVQGALEQVNNNHDAKKRMSEAYKSIFADSSSTTKTNTFFTGSSRGVIK